jgi:hypothetical protein
MYTIRHGSECITAYSECTKSVNPTAPITPNPKNTPILLSNLSYAVEQIEAQESIYHVVTNFLTVDTTIEMWCQKPTAKILDALVVNAVTENAERSHS